MITLRKSDDRGKANFGWLKSRHSFSFGGYHDPRHMGFRALRVINEDEVAPGAGFGAHGHRDMEIVSYVLAGGLEHQDSMGNGSVLKPGDVQRMTAGKGVRHSEFNASKAAPVEFMQIWILPEADGLAPGYEEKHFEEEERRGALRLVASRDGREGSLTIHQDVDIRATLLNAGETAELSLRPGRGVWVQVARGGLTLNGQTLEAGDGAAVEEEAALTLTATTDRTEVVLFDLA